jgi:hypothetical protein
MKISRLLAPLIVILALMAIVAPGCGGQTPVEQATMASEVTSTGEPKTAADVFAPDVSTIYCSVRLAYTAAKSNVKGEWYVVKSDEANLTNSMIAQGNVAAGTPYVVLAFARSDRLLPRGDYEVKIYFDNKYARSVAFKVQGESAPSKATLSEATLCNSIDMLSYKPLVKTDVFPGDISNVFCSVKVDGADFNTNIKARWTYVNGPSEGLKGKVIASPSVKAEGRQYVSFSIGMPVGKQFPIGQYGITLYVEDKEQISLPFSVVDVAAVQWPYISEMSTFSYSDPERKAATLTPLFTVDTKEIDFRAKAYNAPAGTEVNVQWILAHSADGVWADELIKEDKSTIEGTVEIRGALLRKSDPFVTGDYLAKFLVNSKEIASVPFRVQ